MSPPTIFVVGGTGAQGVPVVRELVKDNAYSVLALTRYTDSNRAKQLLALGPGVTLLEGSFASEESLRAGFKQSEYAFVNIDGFNSGEKTEIFWAIRAYELALEEGIKFFVYGNLDYAYKISNYNPKYRCAHYDGKGRVGEWILQETTANRKRMGAALFTTGPYIEMTLAALTVVTPSIENDGTVLWKVPLGEGAIPHVALDDCGVYVRWLLDHQDEANGLDLQVALDHVHYKDLATAFENVTGKRARYEDVDLEEYWEKGPVAFASTRPGGYNASLDDPATMSFKDNFNGWWQCWKDSGKNQGLIQRDYKLLDRIHPNRIRSAEQWFRLEDKKIKDAGGQGVFDRVANLKPVLKLAEDKFEGKI